MNKTGTSYVRFVHDSCTSNNCTSFGRFTAKSPKMCYFGSELEKIKWMVAYSLLGFSVSSWESFICWSFSQICDDFIIPLAYDAHNQKSDRTGSIICAYSMLCLRWNLTYGLNPRKTCWSQKLSLVVTAFLDIRITSCIIQIFPWFYKLMSWNLDLPLLQQKLLRL